MTLEAAAFAEAEELLVVDRPGRLEARVAERRGVSLGEDEVIPRRVVGMVENEAQGPARTESTRSW
jgi:hypothetical protein